MIEESNVITDNKFQEIKSMSSRIILFYQDEIVYNQTNLKKEELQAMSKMFDNDTSTTLSSGITIDDQQFIVQRQFTDMITARRGDESSGEGLAIIKVPTKNNKTIYMICTFKMPILSARIIPIMKEYCQGY
ncbi:hypothetical protein DLAC_10656 [Tieghemostelium lacteum]|uniref:Profilin n=1 Tax=Tieghemostelium lacteum TaxID=361077 RepID=A0A151Z4F4_TIELA|nr:hypothetical protein DLAC_10656 [Tieghemostelium lacteum]|eukprot:KYQ88853.1 hypothetical protein DLAC_10656 [Tieghemostelium lacteum]